jgi:hypothetical protein
MDIVPRSRLTPPRNKRRLAAASLLAVLSHYVERRAGAVPGNELPCRVIGGH